MKTIKLTALLLLLVCVALLCAACGGSKGEEPTTAGPETTAEPETTAAPTTEPIIKPEFSVRYHTGESDAVTEQTVNQLITFFPQRDGYEFIGWYCDPDLFLPWDPEAEVLSDLDLYAEWTVLSAVEGQLPTPQVTVQGNVFSWKPIDGANGYRIRVSYQGYTENIILEETVNGTSWIFPENRDPDVYTVRICAHGNGINTINSTYVSRRFPLRVLSDAKNIVLDRATSMLSWDKVENAEYYEIFLNGEKVGAQSAASFDMSSYDASRYSVKITAHKPNWKTSSSQVTINKQTLRVPNVVVSINPDTQSYVMEWDSVLNATDYVLNFAGKNVWVKDRVYSFNNDSAVWNGAQTVSFTVDAYSDSGDYYISSGGQTFTANKLYTLTVENETDVDVELHGEFWAPVTVSFDLNGANGSVADQTVTKTKGLTYPELPVREGYIFRGWFTEPECVNVFDFTQTLKNDATLYAGWYQMPSKGTFAELGSGQISFESSSSYHYTFFRSLSGRSVTINYRQDSGTSTSTMYFYDLTDGVGVNNDGDRAWSIKNNVAAQMTFSVKAGHVYYVRTESSSQTTLRFSFYEYGNTSIEPEDGGFAVSDYVLQTTSKKMSDIVIYGKTYTIANLSQLGYTAIGALNGNGNSVREIVIPADDCIFAVQSFSVAPEMENFEFESTATTCEILGLKDTSVTNLTLPDYVTAIAEGAFSGCSSLKSITIPFVGGSKKTERNTYQYPFGYIFGTNSFQGSIQTWQYYHGENANNSTSSTYYIPASLKSVTVTGGNILYGAFYNCSGLTEITIPDSVTSIGGSAFSGCSGLKSVTIGNGVASIGQYAFYDCTRLTAVYYTGDVAGWCGIGFGSNDANPLCYAHNLYINDELVTNLVIPNSVTSIGDRAFYGCSGLISITIPNSVTSIGKNAFDNCTGLTSITIPNSVTSIGDGAFDNCTGLTSIAIPNSITSIGNSVFSGCTGLTSVTIGNGVTSIEGSAFRGCADLTSVTIPNSVTSIGARAFSGCSGLTAVYYTGDVAGWCGIGFESYDANPLYYAHNLYINGALVTDLVIPDSVTSIGSNAFSGCAGLTSIAIPDSVTSIGYAAFSGCKGLTSITIPDSVTSIGYEAFRGCTGLTSVTYTGDVAGWCGIAFGSYDANPLYYAHNLYINDKLVTDLVIPDGVTSIGYSAFYHCTGLTSVTIPNSVTSIEQYAFYGCNKLIEVCNLSSLSIAANDQNYGRVGYYAKHVYSSGNSYLHTTDDGYLFYEESNEVYLISYSGNQTDLTLPADYNGKNYAIYQSAFSGCTRLTSVTIPDTVTSIGNYAFRNCTGLTEITIPDGVTSIGEGAFAGCNGLTRITIPFVGAEKGVSSNTNFGYIFGGSSSIEQSKAVPNSLKTVIITSDECIQSYAFYGCSGLTEITILNGVTSIGEVAFTGCRGLTSIVIPDGVTSIGNDAFSGCYKLIEVRNLSALSITAGSNDNGYVGYYAKHVYSSGESYLHTTDDGYIFYEDGDEVYLVAYVGSETELVLPDNYNGKNYAVYLYAFSGCSKLTSVTIGNGVTSIEYRAFSGCSGLTSVTIPDSVTSIGEGAFFGCTGLTSIVYQGTKAQWNAISKDSSWINNTGSYTVHCTDGDIAK